jgi:hypothetical protein
MRVVRLTQNIEPVGCCIQQSTGSMFDDLPDGSLLEVKLEAELELPRVEGGG